ncbi:MAG: hypothetical protein LBP59_10820 [Planctomycetaceae bacterium]|jgi:hypothetical protein|nr:hypothetical protein [Planctomycetaceae bacterium]
MKTMNATIKQSPTDTIDDGFIASVIRSTRNYVYWKMDFRNGQSPHVTDTFHHIVDIIQKRYRHTPIIIWGFNAADIFNVIAKPLFKLKENNDV